MAEQFVTDNESADDWRRHYVNVVVASGCGEA
jgi:hypothetical protein